MKTTSDFSKADLDNLLGWLSSDREEAGKKYLEIREGLVRFFEIKGCYESQTSADETIYRVAKKFKSLDLSRNVKPITLFHGFAKNVFLEYLAALRNVPLQLEPSITRKQNNGGNVEDKEQRSACLEDCMASLKKEESDMMTAYFLADGREKVDARRRLAESLKITIGNLHIKVYRLKRVLRDCIENCLERA